MRLILTVLFWLMPLFMAGAVSAEERYASIVVDADSLDIIHARQIDEPRYPASLTKVMTLYLTFDALNRGDLKLDDKLIVSGTAARTPPFGLGLTRGQMITVDQAIQAVAVRSANDAAVVLAERLAGSEQVFAAQMTQKALELGMVKTTFKTANGLPNSEQKTSARDMAKLSLAILNHHKRYYHYFGQTEFTWQSKTKKNTNGLLHWLAGVDGFKTGFTRASGYNLIISAQRDGRRIIAVVLGGSSGKARNKHMQDLVERSFATLGVQPVVSRPPVTVVKTKDTTKPVQLASAVRLRSSSGEIVTVATGIKDLKLPEKTLGGKWSVQLGAYNSPLEAEARLNYVLSKTNEIVADRSVTESEYRGKPVHRARLTGLTAKNAHALCKSLESCLVIAPGS